MMKKIALAILLAGMQTHAYAQSVPTKAQVNAEILNTINANGRNGITGPILQSDLVQMLAVSASWQGTWGSSVLYSYGEIVSYSGSLWFANTPTLGTPPGSVSGQWTQFSGAAGVITPGTTLVVGGTPGDIEYNNDGVLGEKSTTGSGSVVLSTSPSLTTPNLGTPSAANLANATDLPISTGVSGLGTNVASALAIGIGSSGSVVTNGGALGTPTSGDAGNLTGLPISTGVSGLGIGVAAALSNPLNGSGGVLGTSLASADLFIGNASGIAAGVPMSGDATISNTGALTLAPSGVTAGTYGDGTHSTQVTFDAKGRATSASSVAITSPISSVTGLGTNVAAALANNIGAAGSVVIQSTITGTTALGIGTLQFNSTGANNTTLGFNGLFNNTTGSYNVAVGDTALYTQTTAVANVAIGALAGRGMTGSYNVAVGYEAALSASSSNIVGVGNFALQNLTSGGSETAVGNQALQALTTGLGNTAVGDAAGESITTGQQNTLVGNQAGNSIVTGSFNVGIGDDSLKAENAGSNVAIGELAGSAVTGSGHVFIGYQAGVAATASDTSGHPSIGIGVQALQSLTSGEDNIAIGDSALSLIGTSNNSLAIGNRALSHMVDGGAFGGANMGIGVDAGNAITTGSENTIVGRGAGEVLTTGIQNVMLGVQSMESDVTSNYSTAIGTSSLGGLLSGDRNTGLGQGAGFETEGVNDAFAVTTGDHDTFLGASTTLHSANQYSHVTVIGANAAAAVDGNNTITLGRTADTVYVPGNQIDLGTLTIASGTLSSPSLVVGTGGGLYSTGSNIGVSVGGVDIIDYNISAAGQITLGKNTIVLGGLSASGPITVSNSSSGFRAAQNSDWYGLGSDTYLCRAGASTFGVSTDATCNANGSLQAATLRTSTAYTVSTLPSASAGARAYVTDATACTLNGALTGGGSIACPVWNNGSAWVGG